MSCNKDGYDVFASGLAPDGSLVYDFSEITHSTTATEKFMAAGENTKNDSYCDIKEVEWRLPMFYGVSENEFLTSNEIIGMTKKIATPSGWKSGTFSFVGPGYKFFIIPAEFDAPVTIKEKETGFGLAVADVNEGYIDSESGEYYNFTLLGITTQFNIQVLCKIYRSTNYLNDNKNFLIT